MKKNLLFILILLGIGKSLMAQITYSFSSSGATGKTGPSQSQVTNAYQSTNLANKVTVSGGIQTWVVPVSGPYRINAKGGQGGNAPGNIARTGGKGADVTGEFDLKAGDIVKIIVGQKGGDGVKGSNALGGGGGGASIVVVNNQPVLIAAGGGGAGIGEKGDNGNDGTGGLSGTTANVCNNTMPTTGRVNGVSGVNGNGGTAGSYYSAGGGSGWLSDGGNGINITSTGGASFNAGGTGGTGGGFGADKGGDGGFGGGGGASFAGGGGGGYNGGGGGTHNANYHANGGAGGGSFNNGTNKSGSDETNIGNGGVVITLLYQVAITQTSAINCHGESTASLTAAAMGGVPPYSYSWSPVASSSETISNLAPGSYTVTAIDKNGLQTTNTFEVTQPDKLEATVTSQNITTHGTADGSASISVSGGVAPYIYNWSPAVSTASTANGLAAGSYTVTITDAKNCTTTATFEITQSSAPSTLSLNGLNQYGSVANIAGMEFSEGTVEVWVKPTWTANSQIDNPAIIAQRNPTGTRYSLHINNALDGVGLWNGTRYATVAYAFTKDKWYHLAFVMKSTNTEIFVNGTSIGFTGNAINTAKTGLPLNIGIAEFGASSYFEIFKGELDDIRIWNTGRTQSQIAASYQNTIAVNTANLIAYYQIDAGILGQDNQLNRALIDATDNKYNGKLYNYWAPVVTSSNPGSIKISSAVLGGTVSSNEDMVSEYGIVYSSVNANPTTGDNKVKMGNGAGTYSSTLTGLSPNTIYNVRAYAENTVGTSYGDSKSFRTLNNNSLLSGISLSNGSITPVFNSNVISYSANVDYSVSSITITPSLADGNATVAVAGSSVIDQTASQGINLSIGSNLISIIVTAEDGVTTKTYSLNVTRSKNTQEITFASFAAKTYGDVDFSAGATTTSNLAVTYSSDNTAVATIVNGKIHIIGAGTATITATQEGDNIYHPADSKQQTLTVNKKSLTVTAEDKSKTYGEVNPALTLAYSGLVNGESALNPAPSLSTTATAASRTGTYDITASGTAANYDLTFVKGTLTVNKKALTVTAENKSKTYGDANPALTVTYSGLVNGETVLSPAPVVTTLATAQSNVGNYDITASGAADNYNVTYVKGTLTVGKKALTVTAENKEKFQGLALPTFTASYSGFANGETSSVLTTQPSFATTATANSAQGTYPITVSAATAANYTITFVPGVLTVKPGYPTSITLAATTLYENAPVSTIAGTLSSTSDDPSATFTYTLVSGAGSADNASFKVSGNQIQTNAVLNFESKASYSVLVRSTTQYGLSLDKAFTITLNNVNEQPTLNNTTAQTICYTPAQQTVALSGITAGEDANQTTNVTISSTNNNLFKSLTVTQATNGNAQVRYTVADGASGSAVVNVMVMDNGGTANGGVNTILKSFVLNVNALPVPTITTNKGVTSISKGDVLVLNAAGGTQYQWSNANGILSGDNTANLTIRPDATTTYRVLVTNASGCSETKEITIEVTEDFVMLKGSNLISPNGDGVNDVFKIDNIDMYPNNTVKIFDRAGRLLFSKKDYSKDGDWNGTLNGAPLAEDTYYYVVDFGSNKPKIQGYITIVRD